MIPRITIGIPCYNNGPFLGSAIQSAVEQTLPDCEIIVVDDGSTDTSMVVASAFGERIRHFQTHHRGANHARNYILREARGEWVQFLDADDRLEPAKIETQLSETGQGAESDVIYSPVWIETTTGNSQTRELSASDPCSDIYAQWYAWQLPQTGGALWRRSALLDIGGWKEDQPCCQEHELYARALREGLRFTFAPTPGAVYRIWSEGTLCRKDPQLVVRVRTSLFDRMRNWMEQRKLWKDVHRQVAGKACLEMARTLARYDLAAACAYHRNRRERGMIELDGPAAPPAYRWSYRLLGFHASEKIAAIRR